MTGLVKVDSGGVFLRLVTGRILGVVLLAVAVLGVSQPRQVLAYEDEEIIYSEVAARLGQSEEAGWLTDTIIYAGDLYGVDPLLLTAVMEAESGFSMSSVSPAGACGYMQLMPGTAESLGVDRYNPLENVLGGASYLRTQMEHFARDGDYGLTEAVAAYNAGGGAVEAYGGVPPYRETINYVGRISEIYGALLAMTDD